MAGTKAFCPVLGFFAVMFMLTIPGMCVDLSLDYNTNTRDIPITPQEPEERECYGTSVSFSYSGTLEFHYNSLRKRYAGCTHISGNLEITHLLDPKIDYDLSFLQNIRYVSGYVLLGLITEVKQIPLLNLEIIRGNNSYRIHDDDYSLLVVLTSPSDSGDAGLTEVQMPKLKEITKGKVLFTQNPSLGYVDTIDWPPVLRGRTEDVKSANKPFNQTLSNLTDTSICPFGGMWGNSVDLCQAVIPNPVCDKSCDGRCYGPGAEECCHDTCAVGCDGSSASDCQMCKDYKYGGTCVGFCPARSYPKMQTCVKYNK